MTGDRTSAPKVSVIIPVHNLEDYISVALNSVFSQTYGSYEIIVVLDGCTDGTRQVVNSYFDDRLSVHSIPKSGVSAARNHGLKASSGEIIAFLDGDDYWNDTFLEEMVGRLTASDADVCYCDYSLDRFGKIIDPINFRKVIPEGNVLYEYIRGGVPVLSGTFIVRKCLIDKYNINFTEGCALAEDTEFRIKMFSVGKAVSIRKRLHIVVVREGSAGKSFTTSNFSSVIAAYTRSLTFIKDHVQDAQLVERCEKEILNHIIPRRIAENLCKAGYLGQGTAAVRFAMSQGLYVTLKRYRPDSIMDGFIFAYYILIGHLGPFGKFIGAARKNFAI